MAAGLLAAGCPELGRWKVHEAYQEEEYCPPPPTRHSNGEQKETSKMCLHVGENSML